MIGRRIRRVGVRPFVVLALVVLLASVGAGLADGVLRVLVPIMVVVLGPLVAATVFVTRDQRRLNEGLARRAAAGRVGS